MAKLGGEVKEVMEQVEVVTIGTCGEEGVHLVATWGDYVRKLGIQNGEILLVPAGGFGKTEQNLSTNPRIEVLVGSKQANTGFRLSGSGEVQTSGEWADMVKAEYPWARGALVIRVETVEKLL